LGNNLDGEYISLGIHNDKRRSACWLAGRTIIDFQSIESSLALRVLKGNDVSNVLLTVGGSNNLNWNRDFRGGAGFRNVR